MDMILYTPTEYLTVLALLGFLITGALTLMRGATALAEKNKADLRAGKITQAISYGTDYIGANIGTIVLGVVASVFVPGMIYKALNIAPEYAGCVLIAIICSFIAGTTGAQKLTEIVDLFRDKSKIKALEAEKKQ